MLLCSCGQTDKQKELELKERELALKEKEFELKEKGVSTINTPTPNFDGKFYMYVQNGKNSSDHNECTLTINKGSDSTYKWSYQEKLQISDWKQTQTFFGYGKQNGDILDLFVTKADVKHPVISEQKQKPNEPCITLKNINDAYSAKFNLLSSFCGGDSSKSFFSISKQVQKLKVDDVKVSASSEIAVISPIKVNDYVIFPAIQLSDNVKANEFNSYMLKNTWGDPSYNMSNLKAKLQKDLNEGLQSYEYKIMTNTSSKLVIDITVCFGGAGVHCGGTEFIFDLVKGTKKMKKLGDNY